MAEARDCLLVNGEMEELCRLLTCTIERVDGYAAGCRDLSQSIDMICQLYTSCEKRILDIGENAVIHYAQPAASFVDLSEARNILWELSFDTEEVDGQ